MKNDDYAQAVSTQWWNGLRAAHECHHEAASRLQRNSRAVDGLVVVATALTGTTALLELSAEYDWVRLALGAIGVLAAILAALRSGMKLDASATEHREAAVRYGQLRRRFEQAIASGAEVGDPVMDDIRVEWDLVDDSAPDRPKRINKAIVKRIKAASVAGGDAKN